MLTIAALKAREILDSRGNPTLEVDCVLECGAVGRAAVPSGASTGEHEAVELRDGDRGRYGGEGLQRAVGSVHENIGPTLQGIEALEQARIHEALIRLDRTPNKAPHGAHGL